MKNHKLRIMFNSNAPYSHSGYGTQMGLLLPLIRDEGYPISIVNFFGQMGDKFTLDGIEMFPNMNTTWGEQALVNHSRKWPADVEISLQDIWITDPGLMSQLNRWISYVPIDHSPTPPLTLDHLRMCYRIISMSKFGHDQLLREGFHSTYIPHMVDTNVMKPLDKAECRKKWHVPEDIFLVGMVGANKEVPSRKGFEQTIEAFAKFHKQYPKSGMYFHTWVDQPGGVNVVNYANFKGFGDSIFYLENYDLNFSITPEKLAEIYNCFDVMVQSSLSEGFGVPVIEAQSCGVPVIVNDCTNLPELIIPGKTGLVAKNAGPRWSTLNTYCFPSDQTQIYNALLEIKKKPLQSQDCRDFIVKNYDKDLVFKRDWVPYLQMVENEIYGLDPSSQAK